jgi:hypothetical protein
MRRKPRHIPMLIVLLAVVLTLSSCGALRKQPPAIPENALWQDSQGVIGDVRIILDEEPTTIVLDLEAVDVLFDRTYLP